jgi:rsbT co-antagonist protein RsbR
VAVTTRRNVTDLQPPDLSMSEQQALVEFWRVYDEHFDLVADAADRDAREHPELAGFIAVGGASTRHETRELIRCAIMDNDWLPYLASVDATGTQYAEAGLSFGAWFGAGRTLRMRITPLVVEALRSEPERLAEAIRGVAIFVDLAMITIGGAYLAAKERIILLQKEAIDELSTPVLELRPGLLVLPLIGLIDSERAAVLTESLLDAISTRRSSVVIIDVTGVPAVDSEVAAHLMHTAEAARLMGTTAILAGLSAANAQILAGLRIDFGRLRVVADLADAVETATADPVDFAG